MAPWVHLSGVRVSGGFGNGSKDPQPLVDLDRGVSNSF